MGLARYYAGRLVRGCFPGPLRQKLTQYRRDFTTKRKTALSEKRLRRHGLLSPEELLDGLLKAGVKPGKVTLVHSSVGDFSNFTGTAVDLLRVLKQVVGEDGTLVMPAQFVSKKDTFDLARHPASMGLLCEVFRREVGVVRSAHPGQSVCALGPAARDLTSDHHLGPLGCGPQSPFARLLEYDSQILGLGLPPLWTTFLHVVEDLDLQAYPVRMYGERERTFRVIQMSGESEEVTIPLRDEKVLAKIDPRWLARHVSHQSNHTFELKGIPCFVAWPRPLLSELRELAQRGITAYGKAKKRSA